MKALRVLLIAADSKFPNLALMKICAYHKARGDVVGFNIRDPDIVYISIIFTKNRHRCHAEWLYPNAKIIVGGPGYDPAVRLPPEIESTPPDQNLYSSPYSIGRVTSGCIRHCSFCMVPLMEPDGVRYIQPVKDIWKPGTILRLLDDNILALPEAWEEVYQFCRYNRRVKLHMEYFDIRLMTPRIAAQLRELVHDRGLWFSYDFTAIEPAVRAGVAMLKDAGFPGTSIHFFVYLHDEAMIPDARQRWAILRELDVEGFVMSNADHRTDRIKRITRLGTRPAAWRGMTAEELFL